MATTSIDIFIVDDHRILRDGLELIIERERDMQVVGSAATGEEALDALRHMRPSLILMDLNLPGLSGVETIRALRQRGTAVPIVVLTMYEGDQDIRRALEAGATTYLLKHSLSDDLVSVIRNVHAGRPLLPPEIQARLNDTATQPTLSKREIEVMELVLEGYRNKEIADAMSISQLTVRVHLRTIFAKLDVHDRTAAVKVALRRGIVHIR
ncbi:MAG: response regulator transcription factor [Acidobacteria bacterium]|nr:response regulator transcription factor [Acidobacteriota bacterium]